MFRRACAGEWVIQERTNCYSDNGNGAQQDLNGGIPVNMASLMACQSHCLATPQCDCIVQYGRNCYLRKGCNFAKCQISQVDQSAGFTAAKLSRSLSLGTLRV